MVSQSDYGLRLNVRRLLFVMQSLQAAILTPEGRSRDYPKIKISPYRYPTQPWKGWPHSRGLRPLLFSNSGVDSFTSHKSQTSESAMGRDLRFFALIRED